MVDRVSRIVDIKPPESGEEARNRWRIRHSPRDEIKFVLASRADLMARESCGRRNSSGLPILFSPVQGTAAGAVAEWFLPTLAVRMQVQLHKFCGQYTGK